MFFFLKRLEKISQIKLLRFSALQLGIDCVVVAIDYCCGIQSDSELPSIISECFL